MHAGWAKKVSVRFLRGEVQEDIPLRLAFWTSPHAGCKKLMDTLG